MPIQGLDHETLVQAPIDCPDCVVPPGYAHRDGCDVERCSACLSQRLQCACEDHDPKLSFWTGYWPGREGARMMGWYARMEMGKGWVPCSPDEDGARPDINRLEILIQRKNGRNAVVR